MTYKYHTMYLHSILRISFCAR